MLRPERRSQIDGKGVARSPPARWAGGAGGGWGALQVAVGSTPADASQWSEAQRRAVNASAFAA